MSEQQHVTRWLRQVLKKKILGCMDPRTFFQHLSQTTAHVAAQTSVEKKSQGVG